MIDKPRMLLDGLVFPECPRWIGNRLWLVDMYAHRVLAVDIDGRGETVAQLSDKPAGLGELQDGSVICVCMRQRVIRRLGGDGPHALYADLTDVPSEFLNDMVVDARGRAYVGSRQASSATREAASRVQETLILVDPGGGDHRVVAEDLEGPNGMAITPDGSTLIVAETRGHRLTAFTVNDDGTLRDRSLFAATPGKFPDGICLDIEGGIWFGSPHSHEFCRVLQGGEITDCVSVSNDVYATAVALGGPDGRTLFLCHSRTTRAENALLRTYEDDLTSTAQGWVEVVGVDIPGVGAF